MSKNRRIRETSVYPRDGGTPGRRREVIGVVGLGAAIFLLIAVISLQAGQLIMGPFGRSTASLFASPRISADGRRLAVRQLDRLFEYVLLAR